MIQLYMMAQDSANTVRKKTLAVKKLGEFGESQVIRQSFFRQLS